jgi:hypothetical protein
MRVSPFINFTINNHNLYINVLIISTLKLILFIV